MARILGYVIFFLALTSIVYAQQRSNICLANKGTGQPYRPLQLYPKDCPNNATNCTAAVYNYSPSAFMSKGPAGILPITSKRESVAYLTQDASDNLNAVVITATTYNNNVIKVNCNITGAAPGVQTLLQDDPGDTWNWDPSSNSGNFVWSLNSYYTDGVVLGNIQIVDNFCFNVQWAPNYQGSIATISFLSGNVTNPTRVISTAYTTGWFEFCQYPSTMITKTDASCSNLGSAMAASLNGTATFVWRNSAGTSIGTSASITGLAPGNYTVEVTVSGCTAYRPVTIAVNSGNPITATSVITNPTKIAAGSVQLTISGGNPPYSITWTNAMGAVVATNVTTLSVNASKAGTYMVSITDGCNMQSYTFTLTAPGACPPGTMMDADGSSCDACPAGTYSTSTDANVCTVCPPGSWNNMANATSCNTCPANTMSPGGTAMCSNCSVSTFSSAGSGSCTSCDVGTDRADGASSCSPCAAGSFRCADMTTCQPCPAGSFSGAGQQACTACDPGSFAGTAGLTMCSMCGANSYAASGASSCTPCPSGLSAVAGSSVLLACM